MTMSTGLSQSRPADIGVPRWDPFREIEDLCSHMNQVVQGFAGDRGPPVLADIEETEDAYIVDLDLPGVQPGDVDIDVEGTALRITGEYGERERTGVLRRKERPTGRFEHLITLPDGIDPYKIEARLADGVLSIKVLKTPANRPRRIEVKPQDGS